MFNTRATTVFASRLCRRRYQLMLTSWLLIAGMSCAGAAENVLREQVTAALQGYEWRAEQLAPSQWPADTWQVLLEIADSNDVPDFLQARAAVALMGYPNDAVWTFYSAQLAQEQGAVRRRALDQLCGAFSAQRQSEVAEKVVPLLENQDPHLRARAAVCLAAVSTPQAQAALEAYRLQPRPEWERRAAGFGSVQAPQ